MVPLASILIPAYNAEKWIEKTIISALNQSWRKKEIIIVDDGSTDGTLEIVKRFESRMLKVIHQENQGSCVARNHAFQWCQGDYIQWLDADDLLAPNKIEAQLGGENSRFPIDVVLSAAWGTFFYRPKSARFKPDVLWQDLGAVEWLICRFSNPVMMPVSAWLTHRELTERAGAWNVQLLRNQDGEFFSRVVAKSSHVKFYPESKFFYRKGNADSITRSKSRKALESHCLSFELEVLNLLERERSPRTLSACVNRLNYGAMVFEETAPDLSERLRGQVISLGGKISRRTTSRRYALTKRVIGRKRARNLKEAFWRGHLKVCSAGERLLGKIFGTEP
jgi:glycosyltransferase involved in cell wall biosynthesis